MAEGPEDEDGVRPLVLSVREYFALDGLDSGDYPVTVEVRNQLANLLLESAGTPQHESNEELFRAVMTAVSGLEITSYVRFKKLIEMNAELVRVKANLLRADTNAMQVYTRLLDLENRILEAGVFLEESDLKEMKWKRLKK